MSIQSSINQSLSVAGVLLAMNPAVKAAQEKRLQMQSLSKQADVLTKATDVSAKAGKPEIAQEQLDTLANVRKAQFELDPTEETVEAYSKAYSESTEGQKKRATYFSADPEEIGKEIAEQEEREAEINYWADLYRNAGKQAQNNLKLKQEEKRASRGVMSSIKNEPTSLGGTVSDLHPNLQAAIMRQLTKEEQND